MVDSGQRRKWFMQQNIWTWPRNIFEDWVKIWSKGFLGIIWEFYEHLSYGLLHNLWQCPKFSNKRKGLLKMIQIEIWELGVHGRVMARWWDLDSFEKDSTMTKSKWKRFKIHSNSNKAKSNVEKKSRQKSGCHNLSTLGSSLSGWSLLT
jgi:hypothetical protein